MFVHGISVAYLFEFSDKYFEISYPMDISITNICIRDILGIYSFHSATGSLWSLAAPSDQGCHGLLCGTLHHCDAPLFSRSHQQTPQTRFTLPNPPQPLVHPINVASLLAQRVG